MNHEGKYGASWSEDGHVYIWNIAPYLKSLTVPGWKGKLKSDPLFTIKHDMEGFALAWSSTGR